MVAGVLHIGRLHQVGSTSAFTMAAIVTRSSMVPLFRWLPPIRRFGAARGWVGFKKSKGYSAGLDHDAVGYKAVSHWCRQRYGANWLSAGDASVIAARRLEGWHSAWDSLVHEGLEARDNGLVCDVCNKRFRTQRKLKNHYKMHLRERNKRSGRGNGKKHSGGRRRKGKKGEHALLPWRPGDSKGLGKPAPKDGAKCTSRANGGAKEQLAASEHSLGTVGKRETFTLAVSKVIPYKETRYTKRAETRYVVRFRSKQGDHAVWFTRSKPKWAFAAEKDWKDWKDVSDIPAEQFIELRATPKEHRQSDTYGPETVILRVAPA